LTLPKKGKEKSGSEQPKEKKSSGQESGGKYHEKMKLSREVETGESKERRKGLRWRREGKKEVVRGLGTQRIPPEEDPGRGN